MTDVKETAERISTELEPCPFCGAAAEMEPWHGGGPDKQLIQCSSTECEACPAVTGETPTEAIQNWNRRASRHADAQEGGEPVGWRDTVIEIRDRCSRRPALSGARTKDEILSRALSNSADLAKIMDLCNVLLRQRPAAPSNPVVSDDPRHAFRNADESDWKHLFAVLPDTHRGKFWKAVMAEAKAALSVNPQSGSDKP